MRRRTRMILAAALALTLVACGSKLDRAIAAVEGAHLLVATFKISDAAKRNLNAGFTAAAGCLRAFKADRGEEALRTCLGGVIDSDAFKVSDPDAQARIDAIRYIVKVIAGLPTASGEAEAMDAKPRKPGLTDENVKDLACALDPKCGPKD